MNISEKATAVSSPNNTIESEKNLKEIRVFLVDDHEVTRRGIKTLFVNEPDILVVGESDGKDLISLHDDFIKSKPDIVLLDIRLDGKDGFEISLELKNLHSETKIIFLTGYESELYASEALHYHADGFFTKESSKEFICTSIRMVALGGSVWQSDILHKALRMISHANIVSNDSDSSKHPHGFTPVDELKAQLTSRELQVLIALGQGASNKEIGKTLDGTEMVAKKAVHNVFNKIGVSNRTQAALFARSVGLV